MQYKILQNREKGEKANKNKSIRERYILRREPNHEREESTSAARSGREEKNMNGYKILADAHRKAGQEHKAALFDFLGECTQEDICTLFDSTAFNEIVKAYLRRALYDLQDDNTINSEQAEAIRARHAGLFDEMTAEQAIR